MAKSEMKGVTSRGNYWYARIDGKKKYCGIGEKGRELAEAARAKHIAKSYETRELSVGLKVERVKLKTFEDLSKWYLSRPQTQRLKSYQNKTILVTHLKRHFQGKALAEIEVDLLEDYRVARELEGAATYSINTEISLIRAMYRLAVKRKKIPRDLLPGEFPQVRGKKAAPPRRVITETELERLLEVADEDFKNVVICGYETAMRSAEIANLRAKEVYLDVAHISGAKLDYLEVEDVKNGEIKTPPVSLRLKEVLKRRLQGLAPGDRVFTEAGLPYHTTLISHRMKKYCELAGVPYGDKLLDEDGNRQGVVFHSLRHSRTTRWVEEGWSDQIIMKATGHKSLEVYQGYVHLDASSVMRLVERDKTGTKSPRIRAASGI
jgi:integrase